MSISLNYSGSVYLYYNMSEPEVKEFVKKTEILPFSKYGLSTLTEFNETEQELSRTEQLRMIGLTNDEIKLYHENENGCLEGTRIEASVLKQQIDAIYDKIKNYKGSDVTCDTEQTTVQPGTSGYTNENLLGILPKKSLTYYPEGHPMNNIKDLELGLFSHLNNDTTVIPLAKRRKILRRLDKRERLLDEQKKDMKFIGPVNNKEECVKQTLWDVTEWPSKRHPEEKSKLQIIGPKRKSLYTIKNNKIVRMEPLSSNMQSGQEQYKSVDIVEPVNRVETLLLEGTKMSLDNIKKIDRFKKYEPGFPSKILYLKNIAPSVTREKLSLLFNQFVHNNKGPIDIRLMSGRMRGQAFAEFINEEIAIQALEDVNGTIMDGKPIIVHFGKNSNRIQDNR